MSEGNSDCALLHCSLVPVLWGFHWYCFGLLRQDLTVAMVLPGAHYKNIVQTVLELVSALLPHPPKYWDYRCDVVPGTAFSTKIHILDWRDGSVDKALTHKPEDQITALWLPVIPALGRQTGAPPQGKLAR